MRLRSTRQALIAAAEAEEAQEEAPSWRRFLLPLLAGACGLMLLGGTVIGVQMGRGVLAENQAAAAIPPPRNEVSVMLSEDPGLEPPLIVEQGASEGTLQASGTPQTSGSLPVPLDDLAEDLSSRRTQDNLVLGKVQGRPHVDAAPVASVSLDDPTATSTALPGNHAHDALQATLPGFNHDQVTVGAGQPVTLAIPSQVPEDAETWERNALPVAVTDERPMIAVVLDDLGLNRRGTRAAMALPGPLTLSFMTYAEGLGDLARKSRANGHELMLHVPMEPENLAENNPGPNVLTTGLDPEELARRLDWGLERFDGFVGINNHMGSRFTSDLAGMQIVMQALKSRGLLFLDSKTSGKSVGEDAAAAAGVPFATRDVFIDNTPTQAATIWVQLSRLEAVARRKGFAVAIGHPHDNTVKVLSQWLPTLEARGFQLVPVSSIVRFQQYLAQRDPNDRDRLFSAISGFRKKAHGHAM